MSGERCVRELLVALRECGLEEAPMTDVSSLKQMKNARRLARVEVPRALATTKGPADIFLFEFDIFSVVTVRTCSVLD